MGHPHRGLPATPKEIGSCMALMRVLAGELLLVTSEPAYLTTGNVLQGLLDGIESDSAESVGSGPTTESEWRTGFRVGQSIRRGGSRHL
jgi:hypothetical protein